jgi:predicted RNase H-like HicB family nuclease
LLGAGVSLRVKDVNEIVFEVTQEADGGYCAECLTESIFTQGDTWEELRTNDKEAVETFYFDARSPQVSACISCAMKFSRSDENPSLAAWNWSRRCAVVGDMKRSTRSVATLFCRRMNRLRIASLFLPIKALRVGTLNGTQRDVADHKGVDRQDLLDTL